MNLRVFAIIAFLSAITFTALSQSLTAHRGKVKNGYSFWLYTPPMTKNFAVAEAASDSVAHEAEAPGAPAAETAEKAEADGVSAVKVRTAPVATSIGVPKPVIIFLHGASLCGNNLDRVRTYGTIDAIEKGRQIDAIVIAPQNPGGSWSPKKVMNVLDWVSERHAVDTARIYVIGMSLGGYGTLDMVAAYPDRIAAAMAFCGGTTTRNPEVLDNVPLWIVHGTADRAVSVSQSDRIASTLKATGGGKRLIYDRVAGMNHGGPARLFYLSESYEWLLKHSLNDNNREVATNSIIGSNLIKNAYAGLKFTGKSKYYAGKSKSKRRSHRKARRRSSSKKR